MQRLALREGDYLDPSIAVKRETVVEVASFNENFHDV